MIHRIPVLGAVFSGVIILGLSLFALLSRRPPLLEDGHALVLSLKTTTEAGPWVDPILLSVIIVLVALAGLTILFVVEFLKPRAARKASGRRLSTIAALLADPDPD